MESFDKKIMENALWGAQLNYNQGDKVKPTSYKEKRLKAEQHDVLRNSGLTKKEEKKEKPKEIKTETSKIALN